MKRKVRVLLSAGLGVVMFALLAAGFLAGVFAAEKSNDVVGAGNSAEWGAVLLAGIAAALALITYTHQSQQNRESTRRSHMPILDADLAFDAVPKVLRVSVRNSGFGPALIDEYRARLAGVDVSATEGGWAEAARPYLKDQPWNIAGAWFPEGSIIAAGESQVLLEVRPALNVPANEVEALRQLKRAVQISIKYHSVMGDRQHLSRVYGG